MNIDLPKCIKSPNHCPHIRHWKCQPVICRNFRPQLFLHVSFKISIKCRERDFWDFVLFNSIDKDVYEEILKTSPILLYAQLYRIQMIVLSGLRSLRRQSEIQGSAQCYLISVPPSFQYYFRRRSALKIFCNFPNDKTRCLPTI